MKKIIIILNLIISVSLVAQKSVDGKKHGIKDPKVWSEVEKADRLYEENSFYNAIGVYVGALEKLPENEYLNFKVGMSYYKARDYKNAARAFAKSTQLEMDKVPNYPYAWFYYGETLKSLGQYQKAKSAYIKFYRLKIRTVEFKQYAKFAKLASRGCDYALSKIKEDSNFVKIEHLENDINHAYSDFSPTIFEDELYFSTLRYDSVISYGYKTNNMFPVKIYKAEHQGDTWGNPSELTEFSLPDAHTANPVFSPDGNSMFFNKCWNSPKHTIYCQLFESKKEETGEWGKPRKLHHKVNTHSYTSTQPAYGTSSKKRRGKLVTTNVIYFVSDRPGGYGGKDIWYSVINEKGQVSKPINCGKKVNSARDEITPYYDSEKGLLYFSSNYHKGYGGYDIFSVKGRQNKWRSLTNLDLPINSSYDDTYYENIQTEDTLGTGFLVTNRPGGIALTSETCCDDIYQFQEVIPVYKNLELLLTEEVTTSDSITVIDSVFSDSAGIEIVRLEESKKLIEQKKTISLENARVGIVRKRFVDDAKRLAKTDYKAVENEIIWVDTNTTSKAVNLSLLENKKYYVVVVKDSMETIYEPIDKLEGTLNLKMNKVKKEEVVVEKDTVPEITGTLAQAAEKEDIEEDQIFLLENMYFDTDKDVLQDISIPSLELLLHFLEEKPKVKIEIAGHTDSQGNDTYNADLSQRRAESVKKYLITHGVNKRRLEAKGYGETTPIADNETSEGRKLNRRTEIKILSLK